MKRIDVVVIGAGQAGLAMSRSLTVRDIPHVVLERARIGERWRSERWHSLRLVTPASHSALPGLPHVRADGGSFLPAADLADYLDTYARRIHAPVYPYSAVIRLEARTGGYRTTTASEAWQSRAVVIASGDCDTPRRPACADVLSPAIVEIVPRDYRSPDQLPDGGVLIVGASSTGVQLAEEIHASGRPVTIAVGTHTRLPRRYRGLDIFAAMDVAGLLDDLAEGNPAIEAARRQPSAQLVGRDDLHDLDLAVLSARGVRLAGRLEAVDGTRIRFRDDLAATTAASHERMVRTLARIDAPLDRGDRSVRRSAPAGATPSTAPFIVSSDLRELNLDNAGIRTVIWATGYTRRYPWLAVPVLDGQGQLVHRGGVTAAPGLYALGLRYMRRRSSHFISGCGRDAEDLARAIATHLGGEARAA